MIRWFDWVFLTRPIVLIPSWAFFLVGYLRAHEVSGDASPRVQPLFLPFLLLSLLLAGVYVVNQIYDRETDRQNGKLFLLAEGHISTGAAWVEAMILVLVALGGALLFHRPSLPWLVAALLLGLLYSSDPVRLKGRPVADLLANAFGYGVVTLLFGYAVAGGRAGEAVSHALPYAFLVGGIFLHTAVVDRDGDVKAGLKTSAVLFGNRGSAVVALLLLAGAALLGIFWKEPYPTLAAVGSLPFFLWAVVAPGKKASTLSFQWGSLLFVFLVIIRIPYFGLLIVAVVFLTRLYYRFRFRMAYPRLDF